MSTMDQCHLGFGHFKSSLDFFPFAFGMNWLSQLEQNSKGNTVVGNIWCGHGDVGLKPFRIW